MRIAKNLNFVIPILDDESIPLIGDDGKAVVRNGLPVLVTPIVAYVHAVPLSAEIVDKHFMILARAFAMLTNQGLGVTVGPAVAMRVLRHVAEQNGAWEGPDGVEATVVAELRRTANVATRKDKGWEGVPLQIAVQTGAITAEEQSEVENALAFFIVVSGVLSRVQRRAILEAAADLWSAQISSSNFTEWKSSLPTSTATVSSTPTSPAPAPSAGDGANALMDGKPAQVPV